MDGCLVSRMWCQQPTRRSVRHPTAFGLRHREPLILVDLIEKILFAGTRQNISIIYKSEYLEKASRGSVTGLPVHIIEEE